MRYKYRLGRGDDQMICDNDILTKNESPDKLLTEGSGNTKLLFTVVSAIDW